MFFSELVGRVRVIACLDSIPNLFHTDNYPDYPRNHIDLRAIRLSLDLQREDVGMIVWGPKEDVATALLEIKNRMMEALSGVPNETRQHERYGLTDFERILPGADRMYPDTDHPPIRIDSSRVEKIQAALPEATHRREERFSAYGLPADTIPSLALSCHAPLIDRLALEKVDMKLVGRILGQEARSLERQGVDLSDIGEERWENFIRSCEKEKIQRKFLKEALLSLKKNPDTSPDHIAALIPEVATSHE